MQYKNNVKSKSGTERYIGQVGIMAKESLSNKAKARQQIQALSDKKINNWVVAQHHSSTHRWVEVYPNGDIVITEEADDNTSHYIDYPDTEVACLYEIASSNSWNCGCDTCAMYEQYWELDNDEYSADAKEELREEFIEKWGEEMLEYCEHNEWGDVILEEADINADDIRELMYQALNDIDDDYWED